MTDNPQPEALRLAEILEGDYCPDWFYEQGVDEVAAELRRQHAELETLRAGYTAARLEIESLQRRVQEVGAVARREHERADRAMRAAQPAGAQQPAPAAVAWPSEMHEAMCPALTGGRCTCERNDPTVDKAWARFCGGIGDGPDAPYPGMISAFERYYSQSFIDKDWRNEASVWAAAWKQALLTAAAPPTQPAPQQEAPADELEEVLRERDDAEDFINELLDEVLGADRPEWSSAYNRYDAMNDVRERITALHKPAVDKAWGRFESAMAAPQPTPTPQADSQPAPAVGTIAHVGTGKTTLTGAIASALRAAPVEQPDTARAALPAECDSPELCAVSRSCAGQFGTKRICASRGQAPAGAASVTDAMVLAALQVQYPAGYDTQLRHPANGPKTSARTEAEIDLARRMIAAALATNSAPAPQKQGGQRD